VRVLGLHVCLWAERIADEAAADYLTWPRAAAFAEVAWSSPNGRTWREFEPRLRRHLPRRAEQGVAFRPLGG